jgi:hypothetical protein
MSCLRMWTSIGSIGPLDRWSVVSHLSTTR